MPVEQIHSVCVYCGSNTGNNPLFAETAAALGRFLAVHHIRLVYGGASCGTMGILADSCLGAGGNVLGIITPALNDATGHSGLSEFRIVPTMAERKKMFMDEADVLIALPGGLGTADELFEAMADQTLGLNRKPVALLDPARFFDPVLDWLALMCRSGFLRREQLDLLIHDDSIERLFQKIVHFRYRQIYKWEIPPRQPRGKE